MTTHEVLVAAKAVLMERGWCQNDSENEQHNVCALGAISVVLHGKANSGIGWGEDKSLRAVNSALVGALGDPRIRNIAVQWNDIQGRTFDDVIDLFDKAILATAPEDTPTLQSETPSLSVTHVFA